MSFKGVMETDPMCTETNWWVGRIACFRAVFGRLATFLCVSLIADECCVPWGFWWMWHFHLPELRPRRSPKVVIMAPNRLRACEPCRVTESVTQHHQQCKHVAISDPHQYLSCIKNNQQHRLYDSVQMIAVKVIAVTKHPPFSRPVSRSVDLRLHKIGIASRGVAPPRQHVNHSAVMWPICVTRNHH